MKDKIIKKYIKKALKNCPLGFKSKLRDDLYDALVSFAEEKAEISEETLKLRFGGPEKYAEEFLAGIDDRVRNRQMILNRIFKIVSIIIAVLVAVMIAVTAGFIIYDVVNSDVYYLIEEIEVMQ